MTRQRPLALVLCCLPLLGRADPPPAAPLVQAIRDAEGRSLAELDWPRRQIIASGRARRVAGVPRSRLERSAILDAYANLALAARAARIDGERRVDDLMRVPGTAEYLSAYIQGAAIGPLEEDGPEWVVIRAAAPLYGVVEGDSPALGSWLYQRDDVWADEITPRAEDPAASGVRLEGRGLELDGAFAPAVYDEDGRLVWHVECADRELAGRLGAVEYRLEDADPAAPREGDRPLVVPVLRVERGCDMVVSVADGRRLSPPREARGGLVFAALAPIRTITPVSPFRRVAVVSSPREPGAAGEAR